MKALSKLNFSSQIPLENQSQKSPKSSGSGSAKLECRYCLCEESKQKLIQPCNCEGSLKYVHNSCLGEWIKNSQKPYEIIYENDTAYYTSLCEICKYNMKYQINFENNFFISFIYTMKNTLFSIKSCFFFLLHSLVIFYFFNRLTFLVYHGMYVVSKNFKTKYLMRFVNEMAIFSTILWYTNDIVRYYGNLFFEQRKSLLVFMPKEKQEKGQIPSQFSFQMTVEKINSNSLNNNNNNNDAINKNFDNNSLNENTNFDVDCFSRFKSVIGNNCSNDSLRNLNSKLNGNSNSTNNAECNINLVNTEIQNRSSYGNNKDLSLNNVNILNQADAEENRNNKFFYEIEFN